MQSATLEELKVLLNQSFKSELEIRCDYKGRKELEILNYLQDLMGCKDYLFNEYDEQTLYGFALEAENFINNPHYSHNPFRDYPLCDALSGIYLDYSELCATYAEDCIDKSQIDLSNLESLKEDLAQNLILSILRDYKNDMDYLLKNSDYLQKEAFFELLAQEESKLPFYLEIAYQTHKNEKEIIHLDSLSLSKQSQEHLKEYLKINQDYTSDDLEVNEFLKLEEIKSVLEQNIQEESQTHKLKKHR